MIQATIKQKTSHQSQESNTPPKTHSPLPKSPDLGNVVAALRSTLRMQDRKQGSSEDAPQAPITLMPLPSIPTNASRYGGESEAVYADPADCIRSEPQPHPVKGLYVDPASILPTHPPGSKQSPPNASHAAPAPVDRQDSVYSEVYDKISAAEAGCGARSTQEEPIYSEPVAQAQSETDPFAHLYAKVRKSPAGGASASAPSCATSDQAADDVIYENMGVI